MDDKLKQELLARLDVIAAKLGVAAENLWRIMVQQGWVEGLVAASGLLFGMLLVGCAGFAWRKVWSNSEDFEEEIFVVASATALLVAVVGIILISVNISTALTGLLNPEYPRAQAAFSVDEVGGVK